MYKDLKGVPNNSVFIADSKAKKDGSLVMNLYGRIWLLRDHAVYNLSQCSVHDVTIKQAFDKGWYWQTVAGFKNITILGQLEPYVSIAQQAPERNLELISWLIGQKQNIAHVVPGTNDYKVDFFDNSVLRVPESAIVEYWLFEHIGNKYIPF